MRFQSLISSAQLTGMVLAFAIVAPGCGSSQTDARLTYVGNARVVVVYDEDILLTGITDGRPEAPTCAPAQPNHVVELPEPGKAKVTLRATDGAQPLINGTLHITHLGTKQTWCATMIDDAVTLAPPGQLPKGLYAVSVSDAYAQQHRYEILWQQN